MGSEDRYRLAAVRDVRARTEKTRKGELANAVGDAHETESRLAAAATRTQAAKTAWLAARATRDTLLASGATSTHLARADHFIERRRRELQRAIAEEARCETAHLERQGKVDAARLVLVRARAEREIIERHFERWRSERKKLIERRED
ncbi:MAG TPA: hypothetical protein VMZ53_31185 [Kofleriaceae bacterium]|nr:hypothetical protein [Kofleriaceae bacterium]